MAQIWRVLILSLIVLSMTRATRLSCIFDAEVCKQWEDNDDASHGNVNGLKFCCPPEPNQGLNMTEIPPDAKTCFCKAGTAEKYADLIKSSGNKPAAGDNGADGADNSAGPCKALLADLYDFVRAWPVSALIVIIQGFIFNP